MNYYFFASSLPPLSLETAPSLSPSDFIAQCEEHLAPTDIEGIRALLSAGESGPDEDTRKRPHPFVTDWRKRDTELRNVVVRERAARTGREPGRYVREQAGFDSYRQRAVADAFNRGDPLKTELALDRLRWHEIEELEGPDPFSSNAVLGYALKLQMATRWAELDADRGMAKLDETATDLTQPDESGGMKATT